MSDFLRERVEVIIRKDDKLLIAEGRFNGKVAYIFPGGGIEHHTLEEAAKLECLEEVGIKIKNILNLQVPHTTKGYKTSNNDKAWREKAYTGSITHYMVADFAGFDNSLLNKDGDGYKFFFVSAETAITLFQGDTYSLPRIAALNAL